ncbi:MAG: serine/threonine protein kinase, partial [Planctomycetes bacterium]|nr:serine/threonine protein kinase [Planctomycetota bacterium]
MEPATPVLGRLGPYSLLRELACGGTSTLYEAALHGEGVHVALKALHPELAHDARIVDRFRREAEILARLDHPNLVGARGPHGRDGDRPYFAMEMVRGRVLADLLVARHRLTPPQAAELLRQILDGLGAAHRLGIVHRDLTPRNVVLQKEGEDLRVRIADFGLAHDAAGTRLTRTGEILGTLLYRAPEQCLGRPVDATVDLYAAGAILYEMLDGVPPFRGASPMEIFEAHQRRDVPPPAGDWGKDAGELLRIVRKAMAKEPRGRYADAPAMAAALEELEIPPVPPGGWGPLWSGDTTALPVLPLQTDTAPPEPVAAAPDAGRRADPVEERVFCHACGRWIPSHAPRCASCGTRSAASLFPARCVPHAALDLLAGLLAVALALAGAFAPPSAALAALAGLLGAGAVYIRETYGPATSRRMRHALGTHLRHSPSVAAAAVLGIAAVLASGARTLPAPWGWMARSPVFLVAPLALAHATWGRSRRHRAMGLLRDRLHRYWEIEDRPG